MSNLKYRIKDTRLEEDYPDEPERWYLDKRYYVTQDGVVMRRHYPMDSEYSYQESCVVEVVVVEERKETLIEEMVREGLIKDPYEK